jgi:hypothetical protein
MIPVILKNILGSEKALATLIPTVGVTVALLMGKVSYEEWSQFSLIAMGIYVGGKTIQGSAAVLAAKPAAPTKGPDVVVVAEGGKSS